MTGDGGLDLVDLSLSTAGRWCSKLFSMAGERITRFAPMSERLAGQGRSLSALRAAYLDVDPTVLVDWDHRDALERVDAAVARADVVITSFEGGRYDGPYDAGRIRALNPGAVHLTLSPFGIVGPYRTLRTSSIVDWAASGYLYITGEPDREPLAGPTEFCSYVAGYTGAAAIEAAWHHRRRHGGGHVHLDVSVMEAMLGVHNSLFSRVSTGEIVGRTGNDVGPGTYPHVTYPGSDGELFLGIVTDEEWDRFVIAIDRTDLAADDRVRTGADRKAHRDVVDAVVLPWIAETPVDAAAAGLQARHVPATRECTAADILRDAGHPSWLPTTAHRRRRCGAGARRPGAHRGEARAGPPRGNRQQRRPRRRGRPAYRRRRSGQCVQLDVAPRRHRRGRRDPVVGGPLRDAHPGRSRSAGDPARATQCLPVGPPGIAAVRQREDEPQQARGGHRPQGPRRPATGPTPGRAGRRDGAELPARCARPSGSRLPISRRRQPRRRVRVAQRVRHGGPQSGLGLVRHAHRSGVVDPQPDPLRRRTGDEARDPAPRRRGGRGRRARRFAGSPPPPRAWCRRALRPLATRDVRGHERRGHPGRLARR